MFNEQRIRVVLFYLSVLVFFITLPFILSFALGYKFNPKQLKFIKAGLIVLKSQPAGAAIYLEGKPVNSRTPATIDELLPGTYRVRLELDEHSPWTDEINVEAGKVSRFEKIILFPLRSRVTQLNQDRITSFWVDTDSSLLYYAYIDHNDNQIYIYTSDFSGQHYRMVANIGDILPAQITWKLSPDRKKILFYNSRQIRVADLRENQDNEEAESPYFVLDYRDNSLRDVFWHSDSYHLVLVSNKNIEAIETRSGAKPVELCVLNKKNSTSFYHTASDTLYFVDSQKAVDGNAYDNVYKLELSGSGAFVLPEQLKAKADE